MVDILAEIPTYLGNIMVKKLTYQLTALNHHQTQGKFEIMNCLITVILSTIPAFFYNLVSACIKWFNNRALLFHQSFA